MCIIGMPTGVWRPDSGPDGVVTAENEGLPCCGILPTDLLDGGMTLPNDAGEKASAREIPAIDDLRLPAILDAYTLPPYTLVRRLEYPPVPPPPR